MSKLQITVVDGKIDKDNLFKQLDTELLLGVIRKRNELDRVVTVNEMSCLDANRFRPLMCKILDLTEICDDDKLVAAFVDKVKARKQILTIELDL